MIKIINLSNHAKPDVKVNNSKDWVLFGKNNSFFNKLLDRTRGSVTNGAAVKSISRLIFGKGLNATNKVKLPSDWANLVSLISSDDARKLAFDLYATGNCVAEAIYSKDGSQIVDLNHLPVQTIAPQKVDEEGEIKNFYYAWDWSKVKSASQAELIPAFGTQNKGREILYFKDYDPELFYFSLPVWFAAYQWAELEEEIANYHLNNIQNGLAPSMFISLNNGKPDSEDEANKIVQDIERKYKGSSNAGNIIVQFSDGSENASTITPIPLSDASEQYQFLSDESGFKIVQGHRIPSPMLLGIPTKSGFSSNAEEIKTASILLEAYVLNPQRHILIDGFNKVLTYNDSKLHIEFESLNPFAEEEKADIGASLSADDVTDEEYDAMLDAVQGEVIDNEWELVDKREFHEGLETLDSIAKWANDKITKLEVVKSDPNAKSRLDEDLYKVRYEYSEKYSSSNSRQFCVQMMRRTKNGVVYRYEDITQASFRGVNKSFGHNGQNYSLFKYKGGVNCGHFWAQNLYRRKTKTNGEPYKDKALSSSEEVDKIKGYNPKPQGTKESKIAPKDMPNNGHHPNYKS